MKTLALNSGVKVLGLQGFEADHHGLAPLLGRSCLFAFLLGLALLVGCGGGGGGTIPTSGGGNGGSGGNSGGSGGAPVLVSLGEGATVPAQIVSFELTIDSVTLGSSRGDVQMASSPRRVELGRLKAEPLWLGNAPQGKYRGIVIGVSNPVISYFDSRGVLHENVVASLRSSSASNSSEFGLGSTPQAINLNLFLKASFDGAVVVTPALNFNTWPMIEDLVGRITSVSGGAFTIDAGNGAFTLTTDSGTEFQSFTALSELTAGMTVEVDAILDSSGPFRATRVKLESDDASEVVVEGLALSQSLPQLQMLVREVRGPGTQGVAMPKGKAMTIDTKAATQFHIESGKVDLNNLGFTPAFDALNIALGQNLRTAFKPDGDFFPPVGHLKLERQSFAGFVDAVTAGSVSGQFTFPLTLAPDSAFAQLTGHTSVLVTVQPSTEKFLYFGLEDCVPCIAEGNVRVRGLLFFSGGQYRLVAELLIVG